MDSAGNIYIADTLNERIRVVNTGTSEITIATVVIPAGDIEAVAGDGTAGYNGDGIAAIDADLSGPAGVAVDAASNIYIAEGNRIRKVTATTGLISTMAGDGTAGYNGDGITATGAELDVSYSVDAAGNIYIADEYNQRIRVVGP